MISLSLALCKKRYLKCPQQCPMLPRMMRLFQLVHLSLHPSRLKPQMKPLLFIKEVYGVIVVFLSNYNVAPQPISFASPSSLTIDNVQALLDMTLVKQKEETQTLVNEALKKQKVEARFELQAYTEQQRQESEQYKQSIQFSIATQFNNLSQMLLQNLQQTRQNMLGVVVQSPLVIYQQPNPNAIPLIVAPAEVTPTSTPSIQPPPLSNQE